jgi:hypothetical protein
MNKRVHQLKSGKYRWTYEVSLLKDWSILVLVYKVLFISCFITFFFVACMGVCSEGLEAFSQFTPSPLVLLCIIAGVLVLGLLSYLIYAAIMGGKYCVEFTMDDKEIVHNQVARQTKRVKKIAAATMLVGVLARRPGVVGSGMMASAHTQTVSRFASVRKVKALRRHNLIKVNERFIKNRIYVEDADYDFVLDFIISHCPHADIR